MGEICFNVQIGNFLKIIILCMPVYGETRVIVSSMYSCNSLAESYSRNIVLVMIESAAMSIHTRRERQHTTTI